MFKRKHHQAKDQYVDQEQIQKALNEEAKRKEKISRILPYLGVVFLFVFFSLFSEGRFFRIDNFKVLLNQFFTTVLVVMGCSFLYAQGCLDFAVGSVMAVASLIMTLCITYLKLPLVVGVVLAMVVSVACMSITACAKSYLRIDPFVASMCVQYFCGGIVQVATTKGSLRFPYSGYAVLDTPLVKILVLMVVGAVCFTLFNYTKVGKSLKAMGGNSSAARISGINLHLLNWLAYAICGVTLAIAGLFSVLRVGYVDASAGAGLSLNVITAVVLGGSPLTGGTNSKFVPPIIGAIMVTILTNGLSVMGYSNSVGYLLKGILFLTVVGLTYERTKGKLIA